MTHHPTGGPAPQPTSIATVRGLVAGFWTDAHHVLELPLTPEQARKRLASRIAPVFGLPGAGGARPLAGWVRAGGFTVSVRKVYRNSFQTVARGRWEVYGSRLRIAVTCGVHPFIKLFMGVWLGMCGLFCAIFPLAALVGGPVMTRGPGGQMVAAGPGTTLMFAFAPFAMMAAGLALCAFGRYLARNEEASLLAAIEGALRNP